MKKLMPWLRLGAFCLVLFSISALAVMLKQGRVIGDKAKHDAEEAAKLEGGETKASLAGGHEGGDAKEGGPSAKPEAHAAKGTEPQLREEAVSKARSLFDLPDSISIAESTDLMNELKTLRKEYEERLAGLDLREKELKKLEGDLETRRSEILEQADQLEAHLPMQVAGETDERLDPKVLDKLAKAIAGMTAEQAARLLESLPIEQSAAIFLRFEDEKASEILPQMQAEQVKKLTDTLVRMKPSESEGG